MLLRCGVFKTFCLDFIAFWRLVLEITSVSADDKEGQFLFQRLSVALQRFNAILLHESFGRDDDPDL